MQPLVSSLLFFTLFPFFPYYSLLFSFSYFFFIIRYTSLVITTAIFVPSYFFPWPYYSTIYCIYHFVIVYLVYSFHHVQADFSFLHVDAFTFTMLLLHFTTGSASQGCRSSYSPLACITLLEPGARCLVPLPLPPASHMQAISHLYMSPPPPPSSFVI